MKFVEITDMIGDVETTFAQWLDQELLNRGWSQSEAARRGEMSSQMINAIVNGQAAPGLESCKGIARAFKLPLEDVLRLAGILPNHAAPKVRARRIVYEAATGDRILALWRGLTPDDQALVLALLERLAAQEPRIIGDDT